MSLQKKITKRRNRREQRVRSKVRLGGLLRLSVFRSLNHIYVQLIDDVQQKTLVSSSTLELKKKTGDKKEQAKNVGKNLAKKAVEKGIETVAFDRGRYRYHGRLKALADGLREGGLKL